MSSPVRTPADAPADTPADAAPRSVYRRDPRTGMYTRGWYGSGATTRSEAGAEGRATADAAWTIVGSLLSGILLYAGIGWLLGRWLGHQDLFVAGGALLGIGLAFYSIVIRLGVWTPRSRSTRRDPS